MFVCEFQKITSGEFFGRTIHPSREDAENHAITVLIGFGESREDVLAAVPLADWTCADTSAFGYGVRIFEE